MKSDNTIAPGECERLVAVLLSQPELQEIEAEMTRDASTVSTKAGTSVICKTRTALGWFT